MGIESKKKDTDLIRTKTYKQLKKKVWKEQLLEEILLDLMKKWYPMMSLEIFTEILEEVNPYINYQINYYTGCSDKFNVVIAMKSIEEILVKCKEVYDGEF